MGYLKERRGVELLGTVPRGTCPMCAVMHDADAPHNRDSLTYQYKFYNENGWWPTWADAMAHCAPEVKEAWTRELTKLGVNIGKAGGPG